MNFSLSDWLLFLGVLGAVAATVALLYLRRPPLNPTSVPGLWIWKKVQQQQPRVFSTNLRLWSSILIHLLSMSLLALGLTMAQRDARTATSQGAMVLLILDRSRSMQAVTPSGESRWDRGIEAIDRLISSIYLGDKTYAFLVGNVPEQLFDPEATLQEKRARLRAAQPDDSETQLDGVLQLADGLIRSAPPGELPEVVFVSDRNWPPEQGQLLSRWANQREGQTAGLYLIDVAESETTRENVAITALSARRMAEDSKLTRVYVEITNFSDREQDLELRLQIGTQVDGVSSLPLRIKRREVYREIFGPFPAADSGQTVAARIDVRDSLEGDNQALSYLGPAGRLNVRFGPGVSSYLSTALRLNPKVGAVIDSDSPDPDPSGPWLWVGSSSGPSRDADEDLRMILDPDDPALLSDPQAFRPEACQWVPGHPITREVAERVLRIEAARELRLSAGDTTLLKCDSRPVMIAAMAGSRKRVVVGFDLDKGDVPEGIDFPVIVSNLVNWYLGISLLPPSFNLGSRIVVPLADRQPGQAESEVGVESWNGERIPVSFSSEGLSFLASRDGLYRLTETSGGDLQTLAVIGSLGLRRWESDLTHRPEPANWRSLDRGQRSSLPISWKLLVALALGIVSLEWLLFHRRMTF